MMLRLSCVFLLAVLSLPLSSAVPEQAHAGTQTFSISGTIVERASNRPLSGARVSIAPVQQYGQPAISLRTGQDGRFTFTQLQSGKYTLFGQKHGFPARSFHQDEEYSTAIVVGPGLDSENIVFPLSPSASIAGTVIDDENEPVGQAQVILFSKEVSSGASHITMQNQRPTDSAGQFRFSDLTAGTYFVAVQAHPWYAQNNSPQPQSTGTDQGGETRELDVAYPFTYYPSVTDPAAASPIPVTEGSSTSLQLMLRPVPALHVQVTGIQADPNVGAGLNVTQIGLGGAQSFPNAQVAFNGDHFEIFGIAPGRYLLSPQRFHARQPVNQPAANLPGMQQTEAEAIGSGVFDLHGNENVDISAFDRTALSGHITFETNSPPPANPMVFLHDLGTRAAAMISVASDGSLKPGQSSGLLAGRYEFGLQNTPGFYLKKLEVKGASISAGQIDIANGASIQLSLVAATGLTTMNGIAVKEDKPFAGAMVLLIPKDFDRADFIRRDQSDSDGTFTLPDVPPGAYILLALDRGHDLEYKNPSVMEPYLAAGKALTAPLPTDSPVKVEVSPRLQP